jgi:YD repeat-containing protein
VAAELPLNSYLNRVVSEVNPQGSVSYNYDAVGNLLSITRTTSSPSALAIFRLTPAQGSVGQTVVIQGQNFSTTPSANTMQFNGTAATVTAATANSLTVTVPTGATTAVCVRGILGKENIEWRLAGLAGFVHASTSDWIQRKSRASKGCYVPVLKQELSSAHEILSFAKTRATGWPIKPISAF